MKRIAICLALVCVVTAAQSQVVYGSPTGIVTATLTISPVGSGTGSVTSTDGKISGCATGGGGTCSTTYNLGSTVTLTPTATGGSNFNWSGGTDGASVCSAGGSCTFTISSTATLNAVFSTPGSTIPASPTFSIDLNNSVKIPTTDCVSGTGICPNISMGQGRLWDTSNVLWSYINTSPTTFSWTALDTLLAALNTNATYSVQMALARTPPFATAGGNTTDWATGNYTDAGACSYQTGVQTLAITALSESGSTVTVTFTPGAFTPTAGQVVVMGATNSVAPGAPAGPDTPVGYDGVFTVLASPAPTSTTFAYTNSVTGLGVGTSFGAVGLNTNQTWAGAGQCDPPVDVNRAGTGTDQYFRNWVGALGAHVSPSSGCPANCYTASHAHVVDFECWNEPDTNQFWSNKYGTYDQLNRMCQDAYAIIKGDANYTFSVSAMNNAGLITGLFTNGGSNYYAGQHINATCGSNTLTNATVTASTATTLTVSATTSTATCSGSAVIVNQFTGETAAQVRAAVTSVANCCNGSNGPSDTAANVLMPSYHGSTPALGYGQCYLYCTGTCTVPNGGGANPTNSCHTGGAVHTDAINFHMKPGASLESQMSSWVTAIDGILGSVELAKPLFNTEGGASASGWPTSPINYSTDGNYQSSYIGRFYAYNYGLGITNIVWYDWTTNSTATGGPGLGSSSVGSVPSGTAYNQIYSWLVGASFTNAAPNGCSVSGTVWSCPLSIPATSGSGTVLAAIMWDTSQTCSPCTTPNYNLGSTGVPGTYTSYLTLLGGSTKTSIVSHTFPLGIIPVLVQAQ